MLESFYEKWFGESQHKAKKENVRDLHGRTWIRRNGINGELSFFLEKIMNECSSWELNLFVCHDSQATKELFNNDILS